MSCIVEYIKNDDDLDFNYVSGEMHLFSHLEEIDYFHEYFHEQFVVNKLEQGLYKFWLSIGSMSNEIECCKWKEPPKQPSKEEILQFLMAIDKFDEIPEAVPVMAWLKALTEKT
jgi:hypothetical protein